jgi:hypothetical protein
MGELSISRPPARKKLRITSALASRAARSSPTLNVIQVPRPTSGKASPLDGMRRVAGRPGRASPGAGQSRGAAAMAASSLRRVMLGVFAIVKCSPTLSSGLPRNPS